MKKIRWLGLVSIVMTLSAGVWAAEGPVQVPSQVPIPDDSLSVTLEPKPPMAPLSSEPLSGQNVTLNFETCTLPRFPTQIKVSIPATGQEIIVAPATIEHECWHEILSEETTMVVDSYPQGGADVQVVPHTGNMVKFLVDMKNSTRAKDYFCRISFARRTFPYHYVLVSIEKLGNY